MLDTPRQLRYMPVNSASSQNTMTALAPESILGRPWLLGASSQTTPSATNRATASSNRCSTVNNDVC